MLFAVTGVGECHLQVTVTSGFRAAECYRRRKWEWVVAQLGMQGLATDLDIVKSDLGFMVPALRICQKQRTPGSLSHNQ